MRKAANDYYGQRSQPTYEELKPHSGKFGAVVRFGSQPTYEELKPSRERGGASQVPGSQPTYEELKLQRYLPE